MAEVNAVRREVVVGPESVEAEGSIGAFRAAAVVTQSEGGVTRGIASVFTDKETICLKKEINNKRTLYTHLLLIYYIYIK